MAPTSKEAKSPSYNPFEWYLSSDITNFGFFHGHKNCSFTQLQSCQAWACIVSAANLTINSQVFFSEFLFLIYIFRFPTGNQNSLHQAILTLRMSSKDKYHQSVSKTVKVTCRVETCKEQVLAQNYERHLRRYHPKEDPKILRPYGQKRISFGNKSQAVKQNDDQWSDWRQINDDKWWRY